MKRSTTPWILIAPLSCMIAAAGCSGADEDVTAHRTSSGGSSGSGGNTSIGGSGGSSGTGGTAGSAGTGATAGGTGGSAGSGGDTAAGGSGGSSAIGGAGGTSGTGGVAGAAGTAGAGGLSGTGGTTGTGGKGGAGGSLVDSGPDAISATDAGGGDGCDPAYPAANKCNPSVNFTNDLSTGDGKMFDQVIADPAKTVKWVACRVCTILYRSPAEVTRNQTQINIHIYDFDGVANAGGSNLNISGRHLKNYTNPTDALFEYTGVLVHEITHMYQNNKSSEGGMIEGMADFVRIRAGYHKMNRRTAGGAWTDAYTTGGFFFSWLAGPGGLQTDGRVPADPDIGWAINQKIGTTWNRSLFVDRLGKDVDTLWTEYQNALK
jgi:hypothetical protein